jgi:hypothetical protein
LAVCPAVEGLGEARSLSASWGKVSLHNEHEDQVAFRRVVADILGDHSPAFCSFGSRDLSVFGGLEADLRNMDSVMAVLLA